MATDKPRFSVTFTEDSLVKIQNYKKENNISTQSKAVARLVELAISKIESENETKKSSSMGEDSLRSTLLYNFNQLNEEGQERLVETSDDMVSSGKYKKFGKAVVGTSEK